MRRLFLILVPALTLGLAACGAQINPIQQIVAASHKAPAAPSSLVETTADGQKLLAQGWTNQSTVRLSAALSSPDSNAKLVPEVEFVPAGESFNGTPSATGQLGDGYVQSPPMAAGQQYHWQMRARDVGGPAGPWVPFDGTLGYDATPPPSPSIQPAGKDGYVSTKQLKLSWDAVAGKPGIAGFAYMLDHSAEIPIRLRRLPPRTPPQP